MGFGARWLLLGSLADGEAVKLIETPEHGVLAVDEPVVANSDGAQ